MKLLLLGGRGQLGWEFARLPLPAGWTLVVTARDEVDLVRPGEAAAAIRRSRPDIVLNAMGHTAVDRAESEPELAHRLNADGPAEMALAAAAIGAALIHISTDYVFDGRIPRPYVETDAVAPLSVYGSSKAAGEALVRLHNPRHLILRTSWAYSAHGRNFVKTMLRAARERPEIRVVSDQIGSPTWMGGLAALILTLIRRIGAERDIAWGTYHYCDAGVTSWHGLAAQIFDRLETIEGARPILSAIPTGAYPTAARRPANSRLDCSLIERTFGITRRPWTENLDNVLRVILAERATVTA